MDVLTLFLFQCFIYLNLLVSFSINKLCQYFIHANIIIENVNTKGNKLCFAVFEHFSQIFCLQKLVAKISFQITARSHFKNHFILMKNTKFIHEISEVFFMFCFIYWFFDSSSQLFFFFKFQTFGNYVSNKN